MESKITNEKTHRKVKVVGTRTYLDKTTGELADLNVIEIEDRDFNFHKVWLGHIINSIDLIGNQKTRLAFWILDNLDRENKLTMTYRQIAKKSGISLDTVRKTMISLIDSNFLQRINQGAYRVNPDVIFKGTRPGRMSVLFDYKDTQYEQMSLLNEEKGDEPSTN